MAIPYDLVRSGGRFTRGACAAVHARARQSLLRATVHPPEARGSGGAGGGGKGGGGKGGESEGIGGGEGGGGSGDGAYPGSYCTPLRMLYP